MILHLISYRCLPILPSDQGYLGPTNLSALWPSTFDVCEATNGTTEVIEVDPTQGWASLNFYSPATISIYAVSIDEHPMWVYAIDGRYVEPQLVEQIVIPNGNRYSVFVKLDKPVGDYTIRVTNAGVNQIVR